MKIIINYKFDGSCYVATTTIKGDVDEFFCEASVKSYDVAKDKLIKAVKDYNNIDRVIAASRKVKYG